MRVVTTCLTWTIAAALLATVPPAEAKKKVVPPPCTAGCRFLVGDGKAPLVANAQTTIDAITLAGKKIGIDSGCGMTSVAPKRTKSGWRLKARWRKCGTASGARLTATLDRDARELSGTLVVRKPKHRTPFTARLSECGDGVMDAVGQEQCDEADGNDDDNGSCTKACKALICPDGNPGTRYTSTFAAVQKEIFEKSGCTSSACHGGNHAAHNHPPAGGLDLNKEVAYENLVDVQGNAANLKRVFPGDQLKSLLFLKLAKATRGTADDVGPGMPVALEPVAEDKLELLRLWIRNGAPKTGVVPGTADLVKACLPKAEPVKIRPTPPPAPGEGVQFYAPPWPVAAKGEDEVCYPTYYDFTNDPNVPKFPCDPKQPAGQQCFAYKASHLTQSPNSHHSIIHTYSGPSGPEHPGWGEWRCYGGERAGQSCDPKAARETQCPGGGCAGTVVSSFACIGYGPPDYASSGIFSGIGGSQQPYEEINYPDGIYSVLPAKGIIVWNSHAFNLTDEPGTTEQWFNLYFAPREQQKSQMIQVFDAADIFIMNVPPFERREYCRTLEPIPFAGWEFPQNACLFRLSSHTHKRGVLFRTWGPGIAARCTSRCQGTFAPDKVPSRCKPYCPNGVCNPCAPEATTPILRSTDYSDPDELNYRPPLCLNNPDPVMRRFKFCAIYDNGFEDPSTVKRKSLAPPDSASSCTDRVIACLNGPRRGQLCHGNNSECDSTPAKGDGICDACPLYGKETTDDEMFIQIGNWYMPASASGAFLDDSR